MARGPHFLAPLTRSTDSRQSLWAKGRAQPIATQLTPAFDSASRKRGLLGRASIGEDEAWIIAPCSAVHTFGMQFAIDLVFAGRDGHVIKIREAIGPNRISAAWGAFAVIELAVGTIARAGICVGDGLLIEPAKDLPVET
jgi:uncharacterized membrane protein (UPF0127 family)